MNCHSWGITLLQGLAENNEQIASPSQAASQQEGALVDDNEPAKPDLGNIQQQITVIRH